MFTITLIQFSIFPYISTYILCKINLRSRHRFFYINRQCHLDYHGTSLHFPHPIYETASFYASLSNQHPATNYALYYVGTIGYMVHYNDGVSMTFQRMVSYQTQLFGKGIGREWESRGGRWRNGCFVCFGFYWYNRNKPYWRRNPKRPIRARDDAFRSNHLIIIHGYVLHPSLFISQIIICPYKSK